MPVINDYDYRPRSLGSPPGNDEAADRMVPKQPLHFGPDPRFPGRLNYNLRKLSELPHHLLESRMINELKSSVSSCVEEETHTHTLNRLIGYFLYVSCLSNGLECVFSWA